ncbi:hypothetical protein FQN50_008050 [Emmonsiellopsis sp. PD_5]|nr:hypothetical protein FQN50_008050 [Emmonsiellopsis sp. PD_5]
MSSSSAADIITYIGIPLAVIGVLPILYTCIRAILIHRTIRHNLTINNHASTAITRGSLMSGVVEIELPRFTITPLDRELDAEYYWKLNPTRSGLPGASWSFFHWNMLVTGKRLYRVQYRDELRVPQAEIGFEELVGFLLDRGAVLDERGWGVLRTSGLWTPAGTVLLRPPVVAGAGSGGVVGPSEAVLRVGVPDDSDGVLSLSVFWQSVWDRRGPGCLPPFWMRLEKPGVGDGMEIGDVKGVATDLLEDESVEMKEAANTENDGLHKKPSVTISEEEDDTKEPNNHETSPSPNTPLSLPARITKKLQSLHDPSNPPTSIRFRLESSTIDRIYFENNGVYTGISTSLSPPPSSSSTNQLSPTPLTTWFTSASAALSKLTNAQSPSASQPLPIHPSLPPSLTHPTIPSGILVLLSLLPPTSVPPFTTPPTPTSNSLTFHRRAMDRARAEASESHLPPTQRAALRSARAQAELWAVHDEQRAAALARREYEERKVVDALGSVRVGNGVVAEAGLRWLIGRGRLPGGYGLAEGVRAVLWLLVLEGEKGGEGEGVVEVCERWVGWGVTGGGMGRGDLEFLMGGGDGDGRLVAFCFAALLVWVVQEAGGGVGKGQGDVSVDMRECLRVWKKVRLG